MYHALLTNRYLTSRVIPLIAVAAVALCVALVIIVVSVMSGFLDMVKRSGRTLMGDVVVSYAVQGIPYYERLIERLNALPEVAASTPVVDGFGLVKMPYADAPKPVQFWGIEPRTFAQVTGYEETLHWRQLNEKQWSRLFSDVIVRHWETLLQSLTEDQRVELLRLAMADPSAPAALPDAQIARDRLASITEEAWQSILFFFRHDSPVLQRILNQEQWRQLLAHDPRLLDAEQILREGLTLQHGDPLWGDRTIVLGMHVSEGNERQRDGSYVPVGDWRWWMPRYEVTLTTLPVSRGVGGAESAENRILKIVNEFVSGVFVIDDKRVMIPISIAQSMLHLDQGEIFDDDLVTVIGVEPARATLVLVRASPGITPEQLRERVAAAYEEFVHKIAADPDAMRLPPSPGLGLSIQTWAQQQAAFIGPVEKEREMMRTLFSLVYLVCAGLVLAIFWAIVYEKTRDIGILRSIGASRMGISWIFLRYGMLIGIAGAICGLGLAYVVVRNINVIHEALGNPPLWLALTVLGLSGVALVITIVRSLSGNLLPVVVGSLVTLVLAVVGSLALWLYSIGGVIIWNPEVYYFTRIPNEIDMNSAYITMIGAVIFSLIGAFIPAAKAADTDPVKALRYE